MYYNPTEEKKERPRSAEKAARELGGGKPSGKLISYVKEKK